jgi:AraC family transcriptional regulator of arabinose operon
MEEQKKIMEGFLGQKMIVLTPNIRKEIKANPLINSLYLTAIGYYPHAVGHDRERLNGASEFIFLYCIDGEGQVEMDGQVYVLRAKTPWTIYWLHFGGSNSRKLYERSLIEGEHQVHALPFEQYRIRTFDQIYNTLDKSFSSRDMEIMNFRLIYFITSFIYHGEINPADSIDMASNSISFMKENLDKKLTINILADEQNLSISHYLRIFKAKTGQSPIAYLNQLKIQQSCQYLYFTDRNIKEICALLGIDDQYYFSRLFSKLIGTSPSAYRKAYKK